MAINSGDLVRRVVAGAVYVAITALCTLVSFYTTALVIAVTAGICCYEFLRMAQKAGHRPYVIIGTATSTLIPLACCVTMPTSHLLVGGLSVAFLGAVVMLLRFFSHDADDIVDVALTLYGVLYTGLMLTGFMLLRGAAPGIEGGLLGFIVLASVWINDGAAYLGGSAFGTHKFAPRISPNKTWEGVVCGLVASMIAWLFIPLVLPSLGMGYVWAALSGLVVGIAGIIGDLTESHIKRSFGCKDAGNLIPGHGGLLDRSDSLIVASCVAYAMVELVPYLPAFLGGLL